ncbi:hypothetical protein [Acidiferrobacter sp.]|uniref:hypothetical protein n=1 Tax=Acidiferrobacter sp. TaxID=1872107 RepID=UPI002603D9C6|nr:hypothetical protein [Acidiferrobacter sp.]
MPRVGLFESPPGARLSDYWLELLFFVVEDDPDFIDDMPLVEEVVAAGAAEPLVFDELVLVLGLVAAPVLDDELAGLAVVDEALVLAALWQPASAKRTAEARINFFIMISGTLGV